MFGIPAKVWDLLVALARAYGHIWAKRISLAEGCETLEEFEARVRDANGDAPGGVFSPTVEYNEDGEFLWATHTTGTGRTTWDVWADDDGNPVVWAAIQRPGANDVLELHPSQDGYKLEYKPGLFCPRHISALIGFVGAAKPHVPGLEKIEGELIDLMPQAIETAKAEWVYEVSHSMETAIRAIDEGIAWNAYVPDSIRHEAEDLIHRLYELRDRWEAAIKESEFIA